MALLCLLCALGGFFGLPNPWLHLPPAVLLFPLCLTWISFRATRPGQAFRMGWLAGTMALCSMFYWTALPTHQYGGLPWWLALLGPIGISALLGLYFAFYALLMHLGARKLSALPLILSAGVFWTLAEHLNSFVLSGFPWNALSSGLVVWPSLVQGASLIGAYGLSGMLAALAVSLLLLNTARSAWIAALVIMLFFGLYGPLRMQAHEDLEDGSGPELTLALVQGNVNQAVKWDLAFQDKTIERYENLTDAALKQDKVDLAVWPETALPFYLQEQSGSTARVFEYLYRTGVPLLTGAPAYDSKPGTRSYSLRNRAFLIDAGAGTTAWYDKEHLVPFGEYMPLPDWLGLDKLAQGVGDYTPGENDHELQLGPATIGMLICYEAIFPELAQLRVEHGANLIVNISNDAWFGNSSAPPQHLAHTRMRAIEQKRYIARCTNNGHTVFIDPLGRIIARMPQFQAGILTQAVKPVEVTTIFHDTYHWQLRLLYLVAGCIIAWIVFGPRRTRDRGRWNL